MGPKTKIDGLAPVRLDPKLEWWRPAGARWLNATAAPEARMLSLDLSPRYVINVDALGALRAFFQTADSDEGALRFTERFGPLVEPDGERLRRSVIVHAQRVIVTAWGAWRDADGKSFHAVNRKLAEMGDALSVESVTADAFQANAESAPRAPIDPLERALLDGLNAASRARTALAARQAYVAPLLALLPMRTRLDFDGEALTLRPTDLLSAMTMVLAQRIAVGDASIPCRNKSCPNLVPRWFHDGRSMKGFYCVETRDACRKAVERHAEQDRYPHLHGLKGAKLVKAVRELRDDDL